MASSAKASSELFRGHMEALKPCYAELLGDLGAAYDFFRKWYHTMIIFIIEIGYAPALACMAVFCLVFPLQNICAKRIGQIRQKMVKFTDERVKLINEMLQSIRVIKLYCWEKPIEDRLMNVRNDEVAELAMYLNASSILRELLLT